MNNVLKNLRPTRHAENVMYERDITWDEVTATVRRPHRVYASRGDFIYQSESIAVVVAKDGAVVTVLLRRDPQSIDRNRWNNTDARTRSHA